MNILLHEHTLSKLNKNSGLYQWSQEQVKNGYVIKVQSNFMADLMCAILSKARKAYPDLQRVGEPQEFKGAGKESVIAYNSNVAGIVICDRRGKEPLVAWLKGRRVMNAENDFRLPALDTK